MNRIHARNVVLGAGAMGSAAAYHLAKRGEPVLLVEQFRLGHDRGSSHGSARITRHSYADPHCARMMLDAFRGWRVLEADSGRNLYIRTGGVSLGPSEAGYVEQVAASLAAIDIPYKRMTGAQLNRVVPAFAIPPDHDVVFEPDAGMLLASRIIETHLELAREFGGDSTRILEDCAVRRIDLESDKPTLITDALQIVADRLIVTAGPWVGRLFPELAERLRPTRQQVLYFGPSDPSAFAIGRFPVFIAKGVEELDAFYGMPELLGAGVKAARHGGPDVDPDENERAIDDEYIRIVRAFLRGCLPALAEAPIVATEVCLYTSAPDDQFHIGFWPGRSDLVVASPCSGHGFKFSNLIGGVLADLAIAGRTELEVEPWAIPVA